MSDGSPDLDDVDENRSVWIAGQPHYQPAPALERDLECDVLVLGGGFTGVSSAWHLIEANPGLRVVLLEARVLANGASGRNGGLMLNWVNGVETKDPAHARMVYDATREGIDLVASIIERERLLVRFRRDGTHDLITSAARAAVAKRDVERLRAAGVPLEYQEGDTLRAHLDAEGVYGAIYDPSGAQLDGVGYLRALRPLLEQRGVAVHEHSPALAIEEGAPVIVRTPKATVRAAALVLATNAYTPRLGYFADTIVPIHSHCIATEALPMETWREIGWKKSAGFSDDLDRIAYASLTSDGQLIFGGGSNAAYDYVFGSRTRYDRPADKGHAAVHARFLKYFPRAKDVRVTHRWTGTVDVTMSRVCTMGVKGTHRNIYYALGFSGHGVTLSNLAGRVIADMYLGQAERWHGQPFFEQRLLYVPPEPLRWIGYHAVTALTGKSPRRRH